MPLEDWMMLSLITMVCWGIWGFLLKLASKHMSWHQIYVSASLATFTAVIGLLVYFKQPPNPSNPGFILAASAGAMGVTGAMLFYIALGRGKASIIVPVTALYPVITALLSFFILQEKLSVVQALGVFLAILSLVLISTG